MGKYKILFEGDRTIVIQLKDGIKAQDLVAKGVFIQKADGLYDKKGRKVIISDREFFRIGEPRLVGACGGSVYEIFDNVVVSAGHVMDCVDSLIVDNTNYKLINKEVILPGTYPGWLWYIFDLIGYEPYSPYDYGIATIQANHSIRYNADIPYPHAIYVAGNCLSKYDQNCLGIALATPNMELSDLNALIDRQLVLDCTYWDYQAVAIGVDVGKVFVNYGDGKYALLRPALLMRFLNLSGIPGCSGSMVYPTTPYPDFP